MEFKRFDERMVQSNHLNFDDKGYVSKGAVTKKYAVSSRHNNSLLGYVKFFAQWRQYTFFPFNCILNKDCLREVADFCVELTAAQREKRKPFPASVEEPVVEG